MRRWVELESRLTVHWGKELAEFRPESFFGFQGLPNFPPPFNMTMGTQAAFPPAADPLSAFSALNLLRNYNQFFAPPGSNLMQVYHHCSSVGEFPTEESSRPGNLSFSPTIGAFQPYLPYPLPTTPPLNDLKSRQSFLTATSICGRRPRGEKKPIPEDQKDDRYYERRKRNNQAAKKSRDARKLREDQIALRATLLEHENAILRAQVLTLREETQSLRQLMLSQKKSPGKGLPSGKSECNVEGSDRLKKWNGEFDFGGSVE